MNVQIQHLSEASVSRDHRENFTRSPVVLSSVKTYIIPLWTLSIYWHCETPSYPVNQRVLLNSLSTSRNMVQFFFLFSPNFSWLPCHLWIQTGESSNPGLNLHLLCLLMEREILDRYKLIDRCRYRYRYRYFFLFKYFFLDTSFGF